MLDHRYDTDAITLNELKALRKTVIEADHSLDGFFIPVKVVNVKQIRPGFWIWDE